MSSLVNNALLTKNRRPHSTPNAHLKKLIPTNTPHQLTEYLSLVLIYETGTVRTDNVADVSEGKLASLVFVVVGCGVVTTETTEVGGGTYVAVTVFVMVFVMTVG
jgi:hypothetical protein